MTTIHDIFLMSFRPFSLPSKLKRNPTNPFRSDSSTVNSFVYFSTFLLRTSIDPLYVSFVLHVAPGPYLLLVVPPVPRFLWLTCHLPDLFLNLHPNPSPSNPVETPENLSETKSVVHLPPVTSQTPMPHTLDWTKTSYRDRRRPIPSYRRLPGKSSEDVLKSLLSYKTWPLHRPFHYSLPTQDLYKTIHLVCPRELPSLHSLLLMFYW